MKLVGERRERGMGEGRTITFHSNTNRRPMALDKGREEDKTELRERKRRERLR